MDLITSLFGIGKPPQACGDCISVTSPWYSAEGIMRDGRDTEFFPTPRGQSHHQHRDVNCVPQHSVRAVWPQPHRFLHAQFKTD